MTFAATGTDLIDLVAILLKVERAAVAQGLWIGLALSIVYLVVLLATSWGEKHALTKALVFSLLIHVFSVLGWDAVAPSAITTEETETEEDEPAEPFEVLVLSEDPRELPQPGSRGFWEQPPPPLDSDLARLDRTPTDPLATELPARQPGQVPDATAPPNLSLLPDPTAPEPPSERDTQDTPHTVAKAAPVPLPRPERLDTPTDTLTEPTGPERPSVDRQIASRDQFQPQTPERTAVSPPTPSVPDVTLTPYEPDVVPELPEATRPSPADSIAMTAPLPSTQPDRLEPDTSTPETEPQRRRLDTSDRRTLIADRPDRPRNNVDQETPEIAVSGRLPQRPDEVPRADRVALDDAAPAVLRPTPRVTLPQPQYRPDGLPPVTSAASGPPLRTAANDRPAALNTAVDRPAATPPTMPTPAPEIAAATPLRPQPSVTPQVTITRTEPRPRPRTGPESNVPTPEIVTTVDRSPRPERTATVPRRTRPDTRVADAFGPQPPVRMERTPAGRGVPSVPEVAAPDALASLVPRPTPDPSPRPELPPTYRYREPVERKRAVESFGGSAASEQAVEAALRWLADNQTPAGYWDADAHGAGNVPIDANGFDTRGAPVRGGIPGVRADSGVTALAVLAFLGAGYTSEDGPYADNVSRALRWLVNQQRADGYLGGEATHYAQMYCHAMASYALAEAYAMRSNPKAPSPLRQPLEKAIQYILDQQNEKDGGWRYQKGQTSDMSIFGWNLMALKSAEIAGLEIPAPAKQKMIDFLIERSLGEHGGLAAYHVAPEIPEGTKPTPTMTAEALFCKQMLGQKKENPASREAVTFLLDNLPKRTEYNLYYWYYGTLAMYQYGGAGWDRWNDSLRDLLVKDQEQKGPLAGSWDPKGRWGGYGGRIYSTAMGALSLEVYYRFLPLYQLNRPGT